MSQSASPAARGPTLTLNVGVRSYDADMTDSLSIDPAAGAAAINRAAAAPIAATATPVPASANTFDAAISALLNWAAMSDAAVATALQTRGHAVASHAIGGLSLLDTMNGENARNLGRIP